MLPLVLIVSLAAQPVGVQLASTSAFPTWANKALPAVLSSPASRTAPVRPLYRLLPTFGGVLVGIAGGALLLLSKLDYDRLNDPTGWPLEDAHGLASSGSTAQTVGIVLASVGVAAIIAGVLWYALGPPETDSVASVTFNPRSGVWSF